MTNLKITKLVQNHYMYNIKRIKKVKKSVLSSILIFVISVTVIYGLNIWSNNYTSDIVSTISYIQNPIDPLYSDMGDIIFTSSGDKVILDCTSSEYAVPVVYSKYDIKDSGIEFTVFGPIVSAVEKGVVSDIFVVGNNIKCIKIKHSRNVYSVLENVDIVGVNIGAIVDKGQKIGTAQIDSILKLSIEKNGIQMNLSIKDNIVWIN